MAKPSATIHQASPIDPPGIHDIRPTDPDLARIAEVWPVLPESIRAAIMTLIGVTGK